MKPKLIIALASTYLLAAVITFGFAFNLEYEREDKMYSSAAERNVARSLGCAIGWPLYWSVKASQSLRGH